MLSTLVIVFLPKSKHLLISGLQSLSAVILEPKKIKSVTVSIVSPSICHEVMGLDAMILSFLNIELQTRFFTLFHFYQEVLQFLFTFCHKGYYLQTFASAHLRLLVFLPAILIPACASSSPGFPWCTLHTALMYSPIWNQSMFNVLF